MSSLDPQYLGFIFYAPSPRFVGNEFTIPSTLPSSIKRVGVFVNESIEVIVDKAKAVGFDIVQLHGNESAENVHELKRTGAKGHQGFLHG